MKRFLSIATLFWAGCTSGTHDNDLASEYLLSDLNQLTVQSLRAREYQSNVTIEAFDLDNCIGDTVVTTLPEETGRYRSYMAAFHSDGIRQYARITVPEVAPPANGYPFILFLHGYVGLEKAPVYSIGCKPENLYYSELTDAFARAGFAVLSPGYRGHGTVNGVPAEGVEYLEAFDQGAGLSTQYYAIDALNFAAGVSSVDGSDFPDQSFEFDMDRFFLVGHSQGGDAGLTYLAAIGEGNQNELSPIHSALWSGTFLDRLTALEEMMPVALTSEAFLSGDGSWTGTAIGENGEVNANFVYGYPPDWIETTNVDEWTWQKDSWTEPDVKSAIARSTRKMYQDLETNVSDLGGIEFEIVTSNDGSVSVKHDARIAQTFPNIGGYLKPEFLSENVSFHVPEKDYYSRIEWNENLCDRITKRGGGCDVIIYPHNNHSMRASAYEWFSPPGTRDGYPVMIKNMVDQFSKYE